MKNWTNILIAVLLILALGCSKESTMTDPGPVADTSGFPTNNTPFANPDLPDLSNAVPVDLKDKVNYSALDLMADDFAPPAVGDPGITMDLTKSGEQISGSVLFYFEDQIGFWGALIGSFGTTGRLVNNVLDVVLADDELVIRTIANKVGNALIGKAFVRKRKENENQCKPVIVYCDVEPTGAQSPWWWAPNLDYPDVCTEEPNVDAPCMAYMNTSLPEVVEIGDFTADYSKWVQ